MAKGPLDGVGSKLSADEIRAWIVTPAEMTKKPTPPASRRCARTHRFRRKTSTRS
jgi:hypothetical protein